MPWNPDPKVALARHMAAHLLADRVVIIYTQRDGALGYASYGGWETGCLRRRSGFWGEEARMPEPRTCPTCAGYLHPRWDCPTCLGSGMPGPADDRPLILSAYVLTVDETRLLACAAAGWWLDFRREMGGRCRDVGISLGGNLVEVSVIDRKHGEWLLEHCVGQGIPRAALRVKRATKEGPTDA